MELQIKSAEETVSLNESVQEDISKFVQEFCVLEAELNNQILVFKDYKNDALFTECHIKSKNLISNTTIDTPLDPENQPDYKANRNIVTDNTAFLKMKNDAADGRIFSNIVAEYSIEYDPETPLKIIGGQHRFEAIKDASNIHGDKYHGVKVYFALSPEQRLDIQLISNTNIAVSSDLLDRMNETMLGPDLRAFSQSVGLLSDGEDFSDRRSKESPVTVRLVRTFIVNYYLGKELSSQDFDRTETSPYLCQSGGIIDESYTNTLRDNPDLWEEDGLIQAGKEYAALIQSHKIAILNNNKVSSIADYYMKPVSMAVMSAWSYVAGILQTNSVRLEKHYLLKNQKPNPLNVEALSKGRHKTDPENYRGLGVRYDAKERGRMVEIFYLQAEKGDGLSAGLIDAGIKKYHAKVSLLDALKAEAKLK